MEFDARLTQPIKRGVLRVLADPEAKPYSYKRHDNTWHGLEVDIVESFAVALGVKVKFVPWSAGTSVWTAKSCCVSGPVMSRRLSAPDVDVSIGGYTDDYPEPYLGCATPTRAWYEEALYINVDVSKLKGNIFMSGEGRRGIDDASMSAWPQEQQPNSRMYFMKKWIPKGESYTEVKFCTQFGKPGTGRWRKLGLFRNQIFCRTASMLAGPMSAHIEHLVQTGAVSKLLAKHKVTARATATQGAKAVVVVPQIALGRVALLNEGVLEVHAPTFLPVMDATRKVGIDVEIFKRLAKALGVSLKLKTIDVDALSYDEKIYKLADVWAGGLSFDPSRESLDTQWTAPYLTVKRSCICLADTRFKSLPDIRGKVYVRGGSSASQDAWRNGIEAELVSDNKLTERQIFRDLVSGKVQGVLRGDIVAKAVVKSHPGKFMYFDWDMQGPPEHLYHIVRTESGLGTVLSAFVQRLWSTGEMEGIVERSLGCFEGVF